MTRRTCNRSLAALREVLSAIAANKERKHIPYRSSLLTKVLPPHALMPPLFGRAPY